MIEFHIIALYRFPIYLNQYYYKLSLFRARITSVFTRYVFIFSPEIIHIHIHFVFNVWTEKEKKNSFYARDILKRYWEFSVCSNKLFFICCLKSFLSSYHVLYQWHSFFNCFTEELGKKLEDYIARLPVSTRVIRSEERTGLIRARLKGQGRVQMSRSYIVIQIWKIGLKHQGCVHTILKVVVSTQRKKIKVIKKLNWRFIIIFVPIYKNHTAV